MKIFTRNKSKDFLDLPAERQKLLLLKAAKGANKRQLDLDNKYRKLHPKHG